MIKTLIKINCNHGLIDGFYYKAESFKSNGNKNKLCIIINGLNGFSTYGMFPEIQKRLSIAGVSSITLNFSHGGVRGGDDYFTEIELYEKNCMRLEVLDILCLVNELKKENIIYDELFLISHSLGSIPAVFSAVKLMENSYPLKGIVFISPSMNLDFWGEENMSKWKMEGRLLYNNKRTGQSLPLGMEFYSETLESSTTWNMENALSKVHVKYSIFHGDNDESIPINEAEIINEWNKKHNNDCKLFIIKNANHNYNISHPFIKCSNELDQLIAGIISEIS